jgi:DNA polymerase III subunit epsilon
VSGAASLNLARTGVLVDRALALLSGGPLSTTRVAAEALGLSGNEGVAARAVFTLLGGDPRFAVCPEGVWSLREAPPTPPGLRGRVYAVVDVETTGGSARGGHRVTEVAVFVVEGGRVREAFSSLVNPGRPIPPRIAALTGISDRMVRDAPPFAAIATRVAEVLEGRVFTAHNAAFDWGFLSHELERALGGVPQVQRLCTVRLSRRLLPQLPSRALDSVSAHFGIEIAARHRAAGDAEATAHLLLRLLDLLDERGVTDWEDMERVLRSRPARPPRRRALPHSMESA